MQHTPGLVKIHDKYADRGVKFVALTQEDAGAMQKIENFVSTLKVPWPIGYGATETTQKYEIPGYPTTFVIGRNGKVVWNSFEMGTLDGAIRKAL